MNVYDALMRDGKERRDAFERAKAEDQALFQAQEAAKDLARRLDDERERRTDANIATVQQAAAAGATLESSALIALQSLPTLSVKGRMFYRKFTKSAVISTSAHT